MGKIISRGKTKAGGLSFEIEYGPPFALLDSSAFAPYIRPNALVSLNNLLLIDNQYVGASFTNVNTIGGGSPTTNYTANGIGDLDGVVFSCSVSAGNLNVYSLGTGIFSGVPVVPVLMGSFALDAGVSLGPLTYININGVCYFSFAGADNIYQHNNSTATVLTTYLGAAYLAELNGRLLACNVTQNVSGTITNFPYQMAWSAPGGAYNQFNPLVGGLVTGAGFNNLPDVEDVITGVFTTGPTAYIVRRQGITEVTPLNSGIQPFDFNHLWASHKGIGTVYPYSLAQYGSFGAFIADDDFYTIGYDGINKFANFARTQLYNAIANQGVGVSVNVRSVLLPILVNNNPQLFYVMVVTSQSFSNTTFTAYIYSFDTKEWSIISHPGTPVTSVANWIASITADGYNAYSTPGILIAQFVQPGIGSANTSFLSILNTQVLAPSGVNPTKLIFPQEEILFGRDVTVDGILVLLNGTTGLTVQFSVNGVPYGASTLSDLAPTTGYQLYQLWPENGIPFTGKFPQLTISCQGNGANQSLLISKISMFCTVDEAQRPI